jgi:threonine aldolase
MTRPVELRSDTFTRPTTAMRRAMYEAEVGDDVWNEDPTVHRLEERAAQLLGKDAAVFLSSGTQGNLIGLISHARPGSEVLVGDESHIFNAEAAGSAVVGGLQLRTLPNNSRGGFIPESVRAAIRADDPHNPPTGCLALENSHNRCGGTVLSPHEMAEIVAPIRERGIPVHLDGARVFNAAVALDVPVAGLVTDVDSVTFCLSKGLGAPIGSILCGSASFVDRARHWRKILGGGMRQVGVIAAAGLVALETGVDRLREDHQNARVLAEGLATIPGVLVDLSSVQTNIVNFDVGLLEMSPQRFVDRLAEHGVKVAGSGGNVIRAVTSYEVTRSDIEHTLMAVSALVRDASPALA